MLAIMNLGGHVVSSARQPVLPDRVELPVSTYKRAAYEALRDMVVELELPPGTRLVEMELARRLNVSKTPIREALASLEADGLVDFAAYRGATVSWLSSREMAEQRFLIDRIELPALPLVVERITRSQLADIGKVVRQLKRARARHDGKAFRRLTASTHAMLFAPVGYPRLLKFVTTLVGPVGLRYDRVFVDNFDDTWDIMLELAVRRYEAVAERDAQTAVRAVVECRDRLTALNNARIEHELVAPYFNAEA
jgi:DNA-binding GntR family transcriptional regulator